jgi:hypothetical protein
MQRIPDSGEAYDPVSMTTLVATSLRRHVMQTNDTCLDMGVLQAVGRSPIPVGTIICLIDSKI